MAKANGQTGGQTPIGPDVIARLADDVLPTLVARLERSRLGEIEVRQEGWRIRLRRNLIAVDGADQVAAHPVRRSDRKADRPADAGADSRSAQLHSVDRAGLDVTSPAVGYFSPRDGIQPGASVRGGDVVGYVEVLGVRHDVVVPEDALLVSLDAEAGQAVEYGERLARLEKRSGRPDTTIKVEAEVTA